LWGFGDSGKDPSRYSLEKQIELLSKFTDRMGIPKAVLVGHGLGAAIAARFAVDPRTASRVHRMLLVAPPLVDSAPLSTQERRALTTNSNSGDNPLSAPQLPQRLTDSQVQLPAIRPPSSGNTGILRNPMSATPKGEVTLHSGNTLKNLFSGHSLEELLSRATDPHTSDYEKLKAEVIKADQKAMQESTEAFSNINTFRDLMHVTIPVCALLGENDHLLPKPEEALLHQLDELSHIKLLVMSNTQHFPMLEDKAQFVRLLKDFLEAPDVASLEMKEEWRRRKR
ncbi:MAG TPA: alpha/beta hydrolase, partial [Aggregatilineales bacterium]|nr:alpha/beta hydrolase [Aggregatilineales bacterium]